MSSDLRTTGGATIPPSSGEGLGQLQRSQWIGRNVSARGPSAALAAGIVLTLAGLGLTLARVHLPLAVVAPAGAAAGALAIGGAASLVQQSTAEENRQLAINEELTRLKEVWGQPGTDELRTQISTLSQFLQESDLSPENHRLAMELSRLLLARTPASWDHWPERDRLQLATMEAAWLENPATAALNDPLVRQLRDVFEIARRPQPDDLLAAARHMLNVLIQHSGEETQRLDAAWQLLPDYPSEHPLKMTAEERDLVRLTEPGSNHPGAQLLELLRLETEVMRQIERDKEALKQGWLERPKEFDASDVTVERQLELIDQSLQGSERPATDPLVQLRDLVEAECIYYGTTFYLDE